MPTLTDLGQPPFFSTYDPTSDYYSVLFRPGFAVQTRELNDLQGILRNQIEKFGDAVYKRGTIVDGCNFAFRSAYSYAKLRDNQIGGLPTAASNYLGFIATNTSNVSAFIIDTADGFESTAPNLMTIYLSYRNAGNNQNTLVFSPGDILTIADSNNSIFACQINNAGIGFNNNNPVIFTPALVVNVSSGAFSVGQYVTQPTTQANLQIVGLDATTLANTGQIILSLQPRNSDLAAASMNVSAWAVANNDAIYNVGNTGVGSVEGVIGTGAAASILTDGAGRVTQVLMTARGFGFSPTVPNVRVYSGNNATALNSLQLTAQNFYGQVQVGNTADCIGSGYAFAVSEGTIFLRGLFLRVPAQSVIVDRYDTLPDGVGAGFTATEAITDSNIDPNLLDNAAGTKNEFAPGADRLQIVPVLEVVALNGNLAANDSFFPIVEWSEGNAFRVNQTAGYSALGDELAQRTYEEAGDFVLDKFLVTTRDTFTSANSGNNFSVVIDPGLAYVNGYRVQNQRNYVINDQKGIDTLQSNSTQITLDYGSWIKVQGLAGVFQYNTGDSVNFYDTAKTAWANLAVLVSGNLTPVGNLIGNAHIRSLVPLSGQVGTANATYQLYLFDISMSNGTNFANIRSVAYPGTNKGIADIVLETSTVSSTNVALLHNTGMRDLLVPIGIETLQASANAFYQFRTIDQTLGITNVGILTKSLVSFPNEFFVGQGALDNHEMQDLLVLPLANLSVTPNLSGTITMNTTSNLIIGSSTTFLTQLYPGDFIYFANSTANNVRQVVAVVNNTQMIMDGVSTMAQAGLGYLQFFPENVPIPFGYRPGMSATLNGNGNILTCNVGVNFTATTNTAAALCVSVEREGVTAGSKIANRTQFVLLCLANNAATDDGPWCLGVPDVFRLDAVYLGSNASVNTLSTDITSNFYVDHNQNGSFLDLSFLYLKPTANGGLLSESNYLLVQFSYFTQVTPGWYDASSYVGSNATLTWQNDSLPISNLGSAVNSFEVPEVFTQSGAYYDLLNCMDFRPSACATVNTSSNYASAPLNPVYTTGFGNTSNPANEKQFPRPQSSITFDMTQWLGRKDSVFLGSDGNIFTLRGIGRPTIQGQLTPNQPNNCMKLNDLQIPPYPNLPKAISNITAQIIGTNILSNKQAGQRVARKTILTPLRPDQIEIQQPTTYTMHDIGSLDRRISDLEYYVSLSSLETDMVSAVIPSSVDGTLNRFKYGIFVDDFSTSISQITTDPEYDAQLVSAVMLPNSYSWTVSQGGANTPASYCYVDWPVANQITCTQNSPPANTPISNCVPVTTTTFEYVLCREDDDRERGFRCTDDDDFRQEFRFHCSSVPGVCSLFTHTFGAPCKYEIFQGSTLLHDGDDCVGLTDPDKTFLFGSSIPSGWFHDIDFDNFCHAGTPHTRFCEGSGKITWNHNPGEGEDYVCYISKGAGCCRHRTVIRFCVDSDTIVCPTPPIPHPCEYHHHVECEPRCFRVRCGYEHAEHCLREIPDRDDHCFRIRHHGCRPLCRHDIFCEGINKNHRCRPLGGHIGDDCIADADGLLEYDFFFSAVIDCDVVVAYTGLPVVGSLRTSQAVAIGSVTGQPGGLLLEATAGQHSYGSYVIGFANDDQCLLRPTGGAH